jgi:hypothetical protein
MIRPGRPLIVTLFALLPMVLALWYALRIVDALLLLVGEVAFTGPIDLPTAVRLNGLLLAAAALGGMIWCYATASGLFAGAGWARISAILLALFALPMGYPTDLVVAAIVVLVLFIPSDVRGFFGA